MTSHMRLLVGAAAVALELVVGAEGLSVAEVLEAGGDRGVLLDVDAQVEEVLLLAGDRLAVEASGLAHQDAAEDVVDPRVAVGAVPVGVVRLPRLSVGDGRGRAAVGVARLLALLAALARGLILLGCGELKRFSDCWPIHTPVDLTDDDLIDVVDEEVEELVGILLHVVVELD